MASWCISSMKPFQARLRRVKLARLEFGQNSKIRRMSSEGRSVRGSLVFDVAILCSWTCVLRRLDACVRCGKRSVAIDC